MAMDTTNFQLFTTLRWDLALCVVPTGPNFEIATHESSWWNRRHRSPIYMLDRHRDRLLRAAVYFGWAIAAACIAGPQGLKRLELLIQESLSSSTPLPPSDEFNDTMMTPAIAAPGPHRVKILLIENGQLALEKAPVPAVPLRNLFPVDGLTLLLPDFWKAQQLGVGLSPHQKTMNKVEKQEAKQLTESALLQALPTQPIWRILVDLKHPIRRSAHTHFKTTQREPYDVARARAGITSTDLVEVLLVTTIGEGEGEERKILMVMEGSHTTPYFWRGGRWVTPPVDPIFVLGFKSSDPADSGGQDGTTRRWALDQGIVVEEAVTAVSLVEGEMCWVSNGVKGFVFGRVSLG